MLASKGRFFRTSRSKEGASAQSLEVRKPRCRICRGIANLPVIVWALQERGARREASRTARKGSRERVLEGPTTFVQPSETKRIAPNKQPAPSEFPVPTDVTQRVLNLVAFMKMGDILSLLYPLALLLPADVSSDKPEHLHPQQQPLSLPSSWRQEKGPRPHHGSLIRGCLSWP